jgi:hemerythrin-like domain-containing protein
MSIREFMSQDHKDCDLLFAKTENAAASDDWKTAGETLAAFIYAMEHHFGVEEKHLFPAFEKATGVATGPTEMMRMEHDQMRALFAELQSALKEQQSEDFLGLSETLLILMRQHNIKEEQILYSIMDQRLSEGTQYWQQKFQEYGKQ